MTFFGDFPNHRTASNDNVLFKINLDTYCIKGRVRAHARARACVCVCVCVLCVYVCVVIQYNNLLYFPESDC